MQLLHSPITAEPYREKTRPLRPRRSWFAPAETRQPRLVRVLVEAPGTAPGSEWFIATVIYFHSRRTGTPNIGCNFGGKKGRSRRTGGDYGPPGFRFDGAPLRFRRSFRNAAVRCIPRCTNFRQPAVRIARRSGVLQCSNRKGCDCDPVAGLDCSVETSFAIRPAGVLGFAGVV